MNKSKKNNRRKSRKFRTSRKNRTRRNYHSLARGPSPSKLPCCMCDDKFDRKSMLTPLACLQKNYQKAHKICQNCWWDPNKGFARENANHGCPGCKRKLPLNPSKAPLTEEIIIISD